jgi:RNA polymerase-binding transcription factor DksA
MSETADQSATVQSPAFAERPDLDAIERDLADVEAALDRLDDDTYWTDEITGDTIPDEALADDPLARRAP